jgi:hypothetical protein
MFSSKSSAIAAFSLLFLLLSLVQSASSQAGPAVESDIESRFIYGTNSNALTKKGHPLEEKRNANDQEEDILRDINRDLSQFSGKEEGELKVFLSFSSNRIPSNHIMSRHAFNLDKPSHLLPDHFRLCLRHRPQHHRQDLRDNVSAPSLVARPSRRHVALTEAVICPLRVWVVRD